MWCCSVRILVASAVKDREALYSDTVHFLYTAGGIYKSTQQQPNFAPTEANNKTLIDLNGSRVRPTLGTTESQTF